MNVKEAAKALISNKNFKLDFGIYAVLNIIEVFFVNFLAIKNPIYHSLKFIVLAIGIILTLAFTGFGIITLRNMIMNKEEFLPKWSKDSAKMLFTGFRYTVGSLIFRVLAIIPFIILAVTNIFVLSFLRTQVSLQMRIPAFIVLVISIILSILLSLIIWFISPALKLYFCTKLEITAAFNIKEAIKIIKKGGSKYVKVLVFTSLLVLLATLINILTMKFAVLCAFAIVFTSFIALLNVVLYGDFFRTIIEEHKNYQIEEEVNP